MEYYTMGKKYLDICEQKGGPRKHHTEWGNSDPERQISYVFTHKRLLDIKQRKSILKFTIPENLDNKKYPKNTYLI